MAMTLQEAEQRAREIIAGASVQPRDALVLEKVLRDERRFGLARRILERTAADPALIRDKALNVRIAQKLALCTYKDPDLAADSKLDDAECILQAADDLKTTKDQETLGLAGAIYKRKWELTAQERHLETSLAFYYRGYEQGVAPDYGYTGINAAFVLDLLADLESVESQPTPLVAATATRRSLAQRIRQEIVQTLPGLANQPDNAWLAGTWWFLATLGEACFGLEDCPNAEKWLLRAAALPKVPDWEQESTARQLASLLRIKQNVQNRSGAPINACLREVLLKFLGRNAAAVESVVRGKVGVALSGGGFRASLYHIGVLAKLAELDLLRHVEYLSCVSGGSIIGAHYYLEVRHLLQTKPDEAIAREDYIDIVRRIENDFLAGVETNIRTRIAAEWLTNLKLIFAPSYSRTKRAGELYEERIYSRVADGHGAAPRWLNELTIRPEGEPTTFSPKDHNWRRAAKVPILVLNATSLNTGHNWQFTATWMGEPPGDINSEVDANYRLRRMYYRDAPAPHERMRLGYAVAASACVPGIFEPLTLTDLYERMPNEADRKVRPVVRLVDGGVYDNQGVAALLEQGCSVLLVSDASGQMGDLDFPSNGMLGVPLRANSILQARVRVSQFEELSSRRRGGLLKGLMFVHLKKDLEVTPVDWIESQDPSKPAPIEPMAPYGIQRKVQRRLAAIRTDLDSFSEVEAYGLMTSGYLMTEHALKEPILGVPVARPDREDWRFLAIENLIKAPPRSTAFARQLDVAGALFFKVWLLMRQLQIVLGVVAIGLLYLLAFAAYNWWNGTLFTYTLTVKEAVIAAGLALLSALGLGIVGKVVRYRKTATEILVGIGMATLGFMVARLHLHVFDKLFLWQGRLRRFIGKQ
ncbi:MAG: patatin family protein [Betaproteobacteria bacterium]|nr:MAG: patatin family protein [Betaproteobacteria bacterium]